MPEALERELARLLRQRQEMGLPAVIMEGMTRADALALARAARDSAPLQGAARDPAAAGGAASVATTGTHTTGSVGAGRATADVAPRPHETSDAYETLREAALVCTRCRLSETRTNVVFSDGNPRGRLVVVGEAPGANEDRTGLPFVGQAGRMLDLLLAAVGLSRKDTVYIANVLKCRPPGNRNPLPDEIELCSPYLKQQISLVSPEAILAVGTFSAQLLTGLNRPLGKLRGEVYSYEGVPLVVSYHPAALLRNAGWTRATWDDLQLLREVLDGR